MFQTTNQLYLWWNVTCFFHDFPMFFPWFSQTTNQINIMELGTTPNLKAPPVRSSMSRTSRSGIHRSAWDGARGIGKTGPSVCVTWLAVSGLRQNKMRDICMYIYIYDIYIYMIWYDIYIYDIYIYICIYIYIYMWYIYIWYIYWWWRWWQWRRRHYCNMFSACRLNWWHHPLEEAGWWLSPTYHGLVI